MKAAATGPPELLRQRVTPAWRRPFYVSRMFEFGWAMCPGKASRVRAHAVSAAVLCRKVSVAVLFFGNVNQVLERLWARVIAIGP